MTVFLTFCIFSLLWLNLLHGTWGRPRRLKFFYRQEAGRGYGGSVLGRPHRALLGYKSKSPDQREGGCVAVFADNYTQKARASRAADHYLNCSEKEERSQLPILRPPPQGSLAFRFTLYAVSISASLRPLCLMWSSCLLHCLLQSTFSASLYIVSKHAYPSLGTERSYSASGGIRRRCPFFLLNTLGKWNTGWISDKVDVQGKICKHFQEPRSQPVSISLCLLTLRITWDWLGRESDCVLFQVALPGPIIWSPWGGK